MTLIDFRSIINDLSKSSFRKLIIDTDDYYNHFFYGPEEFTKEMYTEKIGEYLLRLEEKLNCRDGDFSEIYMDTLFPVLRSQIVAESKADKYLSRLKELYGEIKFSEEDITPSLELYSKIFLSIYTAYLKTGKPVSEFAFSIKDTDIDEICSSVLGAKIKKKIKLPFVKSVSNINIIPQQVQKATDEAAKGIDEAARVAGSLFDRLRRDENSEDDRYEPVHDNLEKTDPVDVLTKKQFSVLLLRMFYYRLADFELGADE